MSLVTVLQPFRYSFPAPPGWQTLPPSASAPTAMILSFAQRPTHVMVFSGMAGTSTDVEQLAATLMEVARQKGGTVVDGAASVACAGRPSHRWTVQSERNGIPFITHVVIEPVPAGLVIVAYVHPTVDPDRPDAMAFERDFCPTADAAASIGSTSAVPRAGDLPTFAFALPAGWREPPEPPGGGRMAMFTDADRNSHLISALPVREPTMPTLQVQADEFKTQQRRGNTITDETTTTVCGQPALQWTARGAGEHATVMHTILISAGNAFVLGMYTHPAAVAPRADALNLLAGLCPTVAQGPLLPGWTRTPGASAGGLRLASPDGSSTMNYAFRIVTDPSGVPDDEHALIPAGTITSDATQPCGPGTVRLIDVQTSATVVELGLAYREHALLAMTYTRPSGHPADPNAERALTAACRLPAAPSAP
ncbi:MAG: hypothetical protein ABR975_00465 [Vulcanimicrobiaceae bacterium]|jgi:hypothetical protein